jgi:adenylosuccinate lyase
MKELEDVMEFTHFACTSEDINNLSHALQLQQCVQTELLGTMDKVRVGQERHAPPSALVYVRTQLTPCVW